MPSVHGICFDEGQAGHCGLECEGFTGGECDIAEEIVELSGENNELDPIVQDSIGEFRFNILNIAGKLSQSDKEKIVLEEYGYEVDEPKT